MTSASTSRLVFLFSVALGVLVWSPQQVARADDQPFTVRTGIFTIHLEASKAVYRLGEPIQVRISLHNNTDQHYAVNAVPPWGMSMLIVLNEQGVALPSEGRYPYRWGMIDIGEYPPGETRIIGFANPQDTNDIEKWTSIVYWGYTITEPGAYTVVALPDVHAFPRTGPGKGAYFVTSATDESNVVHIQVVK